MDRGLNAMFGDHIETIKTKARATEKSFALNLKVNPDNNIQQYDDSLNPMFNDDGTPVKEPGKVDAYRFMTFYLEPDKKNFEDFFNKVVDPIWLEQSDDPNAAALRQANQADTKPKCLRIFHRVTFVSRILSALEGGSLEEDMNNLNIESNYELIRMLDPYVKNCTDDYAKFAEAVRDALAIVCPELLPHEDEIIQYLAMYYGVDTESTQASGTTQSSVQLTNAMNRPHTGIEYVEHLNMLNYI